MVGTDTVAVVTGELVVEVMKAFTEGEQCGDPVIACGLLVGVGSFTPEVADGVDAKGTLLCDGDPQCAGDDESGEGVTPECGDGGREDEAHDGTDEGEVAVLELDEAIFFEVSDVAVVTFGVVEGEEPADVGVPEAFVDVVGIFFGIDIAVVAAVVGGPFEDTAFEGGGTEEDE